MSINFAAKKFARSLHLVAGLTLLALIGLSLSNQGAVVPDDKPAFRLPAGMRTYTIAQAAEAWPKLSEAKIDPLDVHVGMKQTIEVLVIGRSPVDSVIATIQTDKDDVVLPLEMVGPDRTKEGDAGMRYRGTWTVRDTHNITYRTTISAEGGGDRSEVVMAWSDACGIPPGGGFTLSSPCTISAADGIDGGNFVVDSSLTLNSDFAFNSGYSMTLGGNGSIALCTTCSLKTTNIWQIDADNDGYPSSGAMYLQDTAPGGGRRRNVLQAVVDCDDTNPSLNVSCETSFYKDEDGDGYYGSIPVSDCGKGESCEQRQGDDCDDTDPRVNPGQSQGFTTPSNSGSFDYNCNGEWEQGYQGQFQGSYPGSCYWHPTWGCRTNPTVNFEYWYCNENEGYCTSRGYSPECGVKFYIVGGDPTSGCSEQGGQCAGPDFGPNYQSCI